MSEREPGQTKAAAGKKLKAIFGFGRGKSRQKRMHAGVSLKQLVRESTDAEVQKLAQDWLHNKRVNTSKPPLGIGCTRKKKGQQGKK